MIALFRLQFKTFFTSKLAWSLFIIIIFLSLIFTQFLPLYLSLAGVISFIILVIAFFGFGTNFSELKNSFIFKRIGSSSFSKSSVIFTMFSFYFLITFFYTYFGILFIWFASDGINYLFPNITLIPQSFPAYLFINEIGSILINMDSETFSLFLSSMISTWFVENVLFTINISNIYLFAGDIEIISSVVNEIYMNNPEDIAKLEIEALLTAWINGTLSTTNSTIDSSQTFVKLYPDLNNLYFLNVPLDEIYLGSSNIYLPAWLIVILNTWNDSINWNYLFHTDITGLSYLKANQDEIGITISTISNDVTINGVTSEISINLTNLSNQLINQDLVIWINYLQTLESIDSLFISQKIEPFIANSWTANLNENTHIVKIVSDVSELGPTPLFLIKLSNILITIGILDSGFDINSWYINICSPDTVRGFILGLFFLNNLYVTDTTLDTLNDAILAINHFVGVDNLLKEVETIPTTISMLGILDAIGLSLKYGTLHNLIYASTGDTIYIYFDWSMINFGQLTFSIILAISLSLAIAFLLVSLSPSFEFFNNFAIIYLLMNYITYIFLPYQIQSNAYTMSLFSLFFPSYYPYILILGSISGQLGINEIYAQLFGNTSSISFYDYVPTFSIFKSQGFNGFYIFSGFFQFAISISIFYTIAFMVIAIATFKWDDSTISRNFSLGFSSNIARKILIIFFLITGIVYFISSFFFLYILGDIAFKPGEYGIYNYEGYMEFVWGTQDYIDTANQLISDGHASWLTTKGWNYSTTEFIVNNPGTDSIYFTIKGDSSLDPVISLEQDSMTFDYYWVDGNNDPITYFTFDNTKPFDEELTNQTELILTSNSVGLAIEQKLQFINAISLSIPIFLVLGFSSILISSLAYYIPYGRKKDKYYIGYFILVLSIFFWIINTLVNVLLIIISNEIETYSGFYIIHIFTIASGTFSAISFMIAFVCSIFIIRAKLRPFSYDDLSLTSKFINSYIRKYNHMGLAKVYAEKQTSYKWNKKHKSENPTLNLKVLKKEYRSSYYYYLEYLKEKELSNIIK